MPWRALRRRCEELLATVAVPQPCDLYEFVSALGAERGRAIRVVDLPDEGTAGAPRKGDRPACGMVAQYPTEDVIFLEPRGWVYRVHVALHEVAHLVCEHRGDGPGLDRLRLFPDLDPGLVRAVLGRTRYSEPQEVEAEAMASILTERLIGADARPGRRNATGSPSGSNRPSGRSKC